MKNKLIIIGVILGLLLGVGYFYRQKSLAGVFVNTKGTFTDLIGTRVGSTTAGVAWYTYAAASTTYPIALGGSSEATIVFDITGASSSAYAAFSVYGSNDPGCSTATTSTASNILTKAQVRWFDAMPFIDNASVISSFAGTSTIAWTNPTRIQRALHFSELNMECMAVEVNASSTILYGQFRIK